MKRAVIVHGWGGYPKEAWIPWLTQKLEQRGYAVEVPAMPDTDHPRMETWIPKLAEVVGSPDEEVVLIGHSIGCQTILRYLATITDCVGKVVLVAPWVGLVGLGDNEEEAIAKPWLETPIDFVSAKMHAKSFLLLFSDNDPFVELANKEMLDRALGGISLVFSGKGHFTQEDGVNELPEEIFSFLSHL